MPKRVPVAPYHHGDLREALISAAIAHVADTGHVELTVRGLAGTVGVSHAAAYRHFEGKAALLAEVARRGFARFTHALSAARADAANRPEPPLPAVLHALAHAYVCFALDEPGLFRVMWDAQIKPFDAHAGLAEAAGASLQVLVDALSDAGVGKGRGEPGLIARRAALVVWSSVHGYATLALEGQLTRPFAIVDPRASVDMVVQALLEGLAREASGGPPGELTPKPDATARRSTARRPRGAVDQG